MLIIKRLAIVLASFLLCSAVFAQSVPSTGVGVPNAAPGVQVNLNAAVDPTVSNDQTQGYQVGSLWQNSSTGRLFIARNVAAGAAVWTNLELSDHPGYIAGNWYAPFGYTSTSTSGASVANSIRCYPGFIKQRITISNLGLRLIATGGAGNVQLAAYANNLATGRPTGAALATTASISAATANPLSSAASAQFEIGMYWFCGNTDTAALTFTVQMSSTSGIMGQVIGSATQGNVFAGGSGSLTGISAPQTFGTWAAGGSYTWTEIAASNPLIGVEFQVNTIP